MPPSVWPSSSGKLYLLNRRLIFTDLAGKCEQFDFYEVFTEKKIEDYRETILPLLPSVKCHADGKGNIWLMYYKLGAQRFCLFDKEGNLLMEYKGSENQTLSEPFFSHDKELILPIYDERQKTSAQTTCKRFPIC